MEVILTRDTEVPKVNFWADFNWTDSESHIDTKLCSVAILELVRGQLKK